MCVPVVEPHSLEEDALWLLVTTIQKLEETMPNDNGQKRFHFASTVDAVGEVLTK